MSSAEFLKKIEAEIEMAPVPGSPYVLIMRLRHPENSTPVVGEMTEADWDKFEADIEAAFEQVP